MDFTKLTRQLNEAKMIATPRTAILWGREDVLGKAVEAILTADMNWQVVKLFGDPDVGVLTQQVEKTNPEIIIIIQGRCKEDFPVPMHIIKDFPKLRVITINPDNNLVEVYNKQEICLEEVSDLLSVIDKHSKSAKEGGENKP
jgi:hypothetical protein